MVFSSLPNIYLDPPNWNQQISEQGPPPPPPPPPQGPQLASLMGEPVGHPIGPTRPVSMAERARLAKIPQPEPALKCPRCDSSNTKFCYFNNYSLSQPRHFCKTCRRYWTRGGALRNVPVGGGCRRNKRNKSSAASSSNSSTTSSCKPAPSNPSALLPPVPPPPFMPAHFSDYSSTNIALGFTTGIHPHPLLLDSVHEYQIGTATATAGIDQWRLQQFPFMGGGGGYDSSSSTGAVAGAGVFPFDGNYEQGFRVRGSASSGLISQLASVKMEDSSSSQHGINLQRQYMSVGSGHEHYWDGNVDHNVGNVDNVGNGSGTNAWLGDISTGGFNSSSTGNIL